MVADVRNENRFLALKLRERNCLGAPVLRWDNHIKMDLYKENNSRLCGRDVFLLMTNQSAAHVNREMNSLDVKTFSVIGVDVSE
jgi:hypothetical protein